MLRSILLLGLVVVMLACLVGAAVASYWGWGVRQVGAGHLGPEDTPSVRSGSVGGSRIVGGGPGSGK